MQVEVEACPSPLFKWTSNASAVHHVDNRDVSTVNISSMEVTDFGTYIVNASNPSGSASARFQLIAKGNPTTHVHTDLRWVALF